MSAPASPRHPLADVTETLRDARAHRPRLTALLAAGRDDRRTRDAIDTFRAHVEDLSRAVRRIPSEDMTAAGESRLAVAAAGLRAMLAELRATTVA
jgi:hypothetical protein